MSYDWNLHSEWEQWIMNITEIFTASESVRLRAQIMMTTEIDNILCESLLKIFINYPKKFFSRKVNRFGIFEDFDII